MKFYSCIFPVLLVCISNLADCQLIDSSTIRKIWRNQFFSYKYPNGALLGCGGEEGCFINRVIFYKFELGKSKRRIKLEGRVIDSHIEQGDTAGQSAFIFLAQIRNDTLRRIRTLAETYFRQNGDVHENKFPFRTGDFEIEFSFKKRDRLFFDFPTFKPTEYLIGELLPR